MEVNLIRIEESVFVLVVVDDWVFSFLGVMLCGLYGMRFFYGIGYGLYVKLFSSVYWFNFMV